MMEEFKITTTDYNIEMLVHGITLLADGVRRGAFECNINGVLSYNQDETEGENAKDWILKHYDTACGAFTLIYAASQILSDALTNDEIRIEKH